MWNLTPVSKRACYFIKIINIFFRKNLNAQHSVTNSRVYELKNVVMYSVYSIVKDSSADLGVNVKIVQNRPTVKAVCTKISKKIFCIFVNIFVFLRENKEVSFFIFWIFKQKQP